MPCAAFFVQSRTGHQKKKKRVLFRALSHGRCEPSANARPVTCRPGSPATVTGPSYTKARRDNREPPRPAAARGRTHLPGRPPHCGRRGQLRPPSRTGNGRLREASVASRPPSWLRTATAPESRRAPHGQRQNRRRQAGAPGGPGRRGTGPPPPAMRGCAVTEICSPAPLPRGRPQPSAAYHSPPGGMEPVLPSPLPRPPCPRVPSCHPLDRRAAIMSPA